MIGRAISRLVFRLFGAHKVDPAMVDRMLASMEAEAQRILAKRRLAGERDHARD